MYENRKTRTSQKWTILENDLLKRLVKQYAGREIDWPQIAKQILGKTRSQCYHQWTSVLDPTLRKGAWTKQAYIYFLILVVVRHSCKLLVYYHFKIQPLSARPSIYRKMYNSQAL